MFTTTRPTTTSKVGAGDATQPAVRRYRSRINLIIGVLLATLLAPALALMAAAPAAAADDQLWITAPNFSNFAPGWADPNSSGQLIVETRSGSNRFGDEVLALLPGEKLLVSLAEQSRTTDWVQQNDEFKVCIVAAVSGDETTRVEVAPTNRSAKQVFDLTGVGDTYGRHCTAIASHADGDQAPIRVTVRNGSAQLRVRSIALIAAAPDAYQAADYAEYHFLGTVFADTMRCRAEVDPTTCVRNRSSFTFKNSWTREAERSDEVNQFYFDSKLGMIDRFQEVALEIGMPGAVSRTDVVTGDPAQTALREVTLTNYPHRYDHLSLPEPVNDVLLDLEMASEERLLKLRAFAMSYIESEGSRGGIVGDDPHRVHLEEVADVMTELGVATEITGNNFFTLRVADAEGLATVSSWPFAGYHRTPGCDTGGVRCPARN